MFENEVNYRLAKWVLLNMAHEGVISDEEMRLALINIVGVYEPPFFELEDLEGTIGDGVIVDGR